MRNPYWTDAYADLMTSLSTWRHPDAVVSFTPLTTTTYYENFGYVAERFTTNEYLDIVAIPMRSDSAYSIIATGSYQVTISLYDSQGYLLVTVDGDDIGIPDRYPQDSIAVFRPDTSATYYLGIGYLYSSGYTGTWSVGVSEDIGADFRNSGGVTTTTTTTTTVTAPVNHAPAVVATSGSIAASGTVAVSSLFSVTDSDGDAITKYEFWDSTGTAGSGYVSVGGTGRGANTTISVSASQLSSVSFVGGSGGGSDQLWVRASDGTEWSDWTQWTMTTTAVVPPTASASHGTIGSGVSVAVSTLFTAGAGASAYEFWDSGTNDDSGYFSVAGVRQVPGTTISVSADRLAVTAYTGGTANGSETVWVRVSNGSTWTDWTNWNMLVSDGVEAPTVTGTSNHAVAAGASTAASGLFTANTTGGRSAARYQFWDSGGGSDSGYFAIDGVAQASGTLIEATPSQLSGVAWVGGTAVGSETAWVRFSDGTGWSEWLGWTMTTSAGSTAMAASPAGQLRPERSGATFSVVA